jgi:probable HAF family extracellular repeat protein
MYRLIVFAHFVAALIPLSSAGLLWGQPPGVTIVDLETLGNEFSEAYDINNSGEVVGRSGNRAILWTWREGMIDLGAPVGEFSSARRINERGEVIGSSGQRGFYWSRATGYVDLGTAGGHVAYPRAINELGQVVGGSTYSPGSFSEHAFLWSRETGLEDLGTLGGGFSVAVGINDVGQILGTSETANGKNIPFLWTRETGMIRFLPATYPGPNVLRINNSGEVAGRLGANAFIWSGELGLIDLGTLGGSYSVATDINEAGQVAGFSEAFWPRDPHAFLWSLERGMVDLGGFGGRSLVVAEMNRVGQMTGWATLGSASPITTNAFVAFPEGDILALGVLDGRSSVGQAINDRGQIVGYSSVTGSAYPHATMWIFATPAEQVEWIIQEIEKLVEHGDLTAQQGMMLIAPLRSSRNFWDAGRPAVANDKLRSFIRLVEIFFSKGVLSATEADFLIDRAEWILSQSAG